MLCLCFVLVTGMDASQHPYKVNEVLSVPARPFKGVLTHGRMERESAVAYGDAT